MLDRIIRLTTNFHGDAKPFAVSYANRGVTQNIFTLIGSMALTFSLLSVPLVLHAGTITVSPGQNVQQAINRAQPGDTITLKNGVCDNPRLELSRSGTASAPITLRAEDPGRVKLAKAIISITGNYWIVEGFDFDNEAPNSSSNPGVIRILNGGSDNIIRENRFANMPNGVIFISPGHRNIIERNTMQNHGRGSIYADNSNENMVRFNRIIGQPSGVSLFVGNGGNSPGTKFEYNHVADGDGWLYGELIAIKSDDARLYGNYFTNNHGGGLVLRHNDRAVVECNEFIDNRGITANGSGHIIRNNYFLRDSNEPGGSEAIVLQSGDHAEKQPFSDYQAAHDAIVENNTVVNWQNGEFSIGYNFGRFQNNNGYPLKFVFAPQNAKITNNIFCDPNDNNAKSILNTASPGAQWSGNIVWAGNNGDIPSSGVTVADPKMQRASDGTLRSTAYPNAGYQGCNVPRNPLDVGARWTGSTGWTVENQSNREKGFVPLFDGKTLDGWQGATEHWAAEKGSLVFIRKGAARSKKELLGLKLMSTKEYSDFILRFDIKLPKGSNNGVAIRAPLEGDPAFVGMEIQVQDPQYYRNLKDYEVFGSIYGVVPAKTGDLKPNGEWNTEEILCVGRRVKVTLNGTVIVDVDLESIGDKTKDVADHPGLKRTKGHIGFCGHTGRVEYRNIRTKDLSGRRAE